MRSGAECRLEREALDRERVGGGILRLATAGARVLLVAAAFAGCAPGRGDAAQAGALAQGNADRGARLIRSYGCTACHTVPGVSGGETTVGPPLAGIAGRAYIAGVLPNTPDNMVDWIHNPPAQDSKTAMPYLGVSKAEARDIAAYLYTLH
ncbi:MAG: uncharacterized protein JWM27_257 [Gemmatimonadetes bacterium]|nr:uncharacterized protein [Gemmatimonadota bacterium]